MSDTRPRDLTPEELALLQLPASGGAGSAPSRIPPGTEIAIEELNPMAHDAAATASPRYGPDDAQSPNGSGAPGAAAVG